MPEEERTREHADAQVAFDYIKSQFFRVVHADGVIGGLTPNGGLHLVFFSERPPIPRRDVRFVKTDGALGESVPERMDIRDAIVREMDFDVIMSLPTAEAFVIWLQDRVRELRARGSNQTATRDSSP